MPIPTLPPPPLRDASGSPVWDRWFNQLWSIASRVRLSSSGPTITQGDGAPTAEQPNGSLYLETATGGLWLRTGGAWVLK